MLTIYNCMLLSSEPYRKDGELKGYRATFLGMNGSGVVGRVFNVYVPYSEELPMVFTDFSHSNSNISKNDMLVFDLVYDFAVYDNKLSLKLVGMSESDEV